jgi:two-component system CheB/CheR fusion protein
MHESQHLAEDLERARATQGRGEQQRQRLAATNRDLLAANGQLTREIDELRAQNESYLIGNEEMQAASEEVETLNEELQSTNEELETLNEEMQATVEELNTTNDDLQTRNLEIQDLAVRLESGSARLQAVLNSLGDAIAVVDSRGRTVLTNSRYAQLLPGPLDALDMAGVDGDPLPADATPQQRGARSESFRMTFTLREPDGLLRRYEVTGQPIQGSEVGGGVLVIHRLDDGA